MYTNRTKYIRLTTTFSLDSDDDFRPGCRNLSHHYRQQSLSGLHSPGRSHYYMLPPGGFVGSNHLLKSPLVEREKYFRTHFIYCFNWMWYQRPFFAQVWLFCDLSLWSWPAIVPSFFVQFSSATFFWSRRQCVETWDLSSVIDKNSAFG